MWERPNECVCVRVKANWRGNGSGRACASLRHVPLLCSLATHACPCPATFASVKLRQRATRKQPGPPCTAQSQPHWTRRRKLPGPSFTPTRSATDAAATAGGMPQQPCVSRPRKSAPPRAEAAAPPRGCTKSARGGRGSGGGACCRDQPPTRRPARKARVFPRRRPP